MLNSLNYIGQLLLTVVFWARCTLLKQHNYTCAASENIKATQAQIDTGVEGFFDYAKMYCKDCGHVYTSPRNKN